MAKFFGKVGYAAAAEIENGVWEDQITEVKYYGDVIRNTRRLQNGSELNSDLTVSNSISIVADAYANEHFFAIRYVEWGGALWTVTNVEVQSPRLILQLGGVWDGSTPATDHS